MLDFKKGDYVSCYKIRRTRDYGFFPCSTKYEADLVEGHVVSVRDTNVDKLAYKTVMRTPEIERSQYLVTFKTADGIVKSYDGCLVLVKVISRAENYDDVMDKLRELD